MYFQRTNWVVADTEQCYLKYERKDTTHLLIQSLSIKNWINDSIYDTIRYDTRVIKFYFKESWGDALKKSSCVVNCSLICYLISSSCCSTVPYRSRCRCGSKVKKNQAKSPLAQIRMLRISLSQLKQITMLSLLKLFNIYSWTNLCWLWNAF